MECSQLGLISDKDRQPSGPGPVDLTEAKGPDSLQARDPDKVGRLENVGQALSSQAARVRHVLFFGFFSL